MFLTASRSFTWTHLAFYATGRGMNGDAEIVGSLKIDPELGCVAEVARQTQRGIGVERPSTFDDLADSVYRNFQFARQTSDRESQGLHEVFSKNLSGVNRRHSAILLR